MEKLQAFVFLCQFSIWEKYHILIVLFAHVTSFLDDEENLKITPSEDWEYLRENGLCNFSILCFCFFLVVNDCRNSKTSTD